jgi:hypothetical protein
MITAREGDGFAIAEAEEKLTLPREPSFRSDTGEAHVRFTSQCCVARALALAAAPSPSPFLAVDVSKASLRLCLRARVRVCVRGAHARPPACEDGETNFYMFSDVRACRRAGCRTTRPLRRAHAPLSS